MNKDSLQFCMGKRKIDLSTNLLGPKNLCLQKPTRKWDVFENVPTIACAVFLLTLKRLSLGTSFYHEYKKHSLNYEVRSADERILLVPS